MTALIANPLTAELIKKFMIQLVGSFVVSYLAQTLGPLIQYLRA